MVGRALARGDRVLIRRWRPDDMDAFVRLARASAERFRPWISPPVGDEEFREFLRRGRRRDVESFAVVRAADGALGGWVNINNIVRRAFQSGAVGYAGFTPTAGQGLVTEAGPRGALRVHQPGAAPTRGEHPARQSGIARRGRAPVVPPGGMVAGVPHGGRQVAGPRAVGHHRGRGPCPRARELQARELQAGEPQGRESQARELQAMEAMISATIPTVVPGWRNTSRATVSPSHLVGVTRATWSSRSRVDHRR